MMVFRSHPLPSIPLERQKADHSSGADAIRRSTSAAEGQSAQRDRSHAQRSEHGEDQPLAWSEHVDLLIASARGTYQHPTPRPAFAISPRSHPQPHATRQTTCPKFSSTTPTATSLTDHIEPHHPIPMHPTASRHQPHHTPHPHLTTDTHSSFFLFPFFLHFLSFFLPHSLLFLTHPIFH